MKSSIRKVLSVFLSLCMVMTLSCIAFAEDAFVGTFEISGGKASITTYPTSDYTANALENQTEAKATNSATGEIDVSGNGQINFTVVPEEGYEVVSVTASGNYKNIKGPVDTAKENTYRLTKITGNLTINVQLQESSSEPITVEPYVGTFEISGGNASVTTYATSDYTANALENQTEAKATNSDTGEIDVTGNGQINFTVVPEEGYEVLSVSASGNYKNIKGPADTAKENTYRITKITGDLTIKITLGQIPEEPDTSETVVTFSQDGATVSGSAKGLSIDGTSVTISAAGTYNFTGSCSNGNILVAKNAGDVQIVLDGLELTSTTTAPIAAKGATNVEIVAKEGSVNVISDTDRSQLSPKACINSAANLSFSGTGTLTVNGNNKNAIKADGNVSISSLNLNVTALDNGISADNVLLISSGTIDVLSKQGDCLKSNPDLLTASTLGQIQISGGSIKLNAESNDGIQALSDIIIDGGELDITSGGGSTVNIPSSDTGSYKGIKADNNLAINAGTIKINSADDAIHANGNVSIKGGAFEIYAGGNGIHADSELTVDSATIDIKESAEGAEANVVTLSASDIKINSKDDGINAFVAENSENAGIVTINSGNLYINSLGDGIDSNGNIVLNGGTVIICGPTKSTDAAIDYDGTFTINSGLLLAVGSADEAQAPNGGTQASVKFTVEKQAANTVICIKDSDGNAIAAFESPKAFESVVFSGSGIAESASYTLSLGGSIADAQAGVLYTENFAYDGGEDAATVVALITEVSNGGEEETTTPEETQPTEEETQPNEENPAPSEDDSNPSNSTNSFLQKLVAFWQDLLNLSKEFSHFNSLKIYID
jgi:hypothetical protein